MVLRKKVTKSSFRGRDMTFFEDLTSRKPAHSLSKLAELSHPHSENRNKFHDLSSIRTSFVMLGSFRTVHLFSMSFVVFLFEQTTILLADI